MVNNAVSISGGKDSTAMLLEMLRRGERICTAVFFDTGWEFPAMYDHLERLEEYTGVKIWRLHPPMPFDYWAVARPVKAREGKYKGQIHRIGHGWPLISQRWCTRQKVDVIDRFCGAIPNVIQCVGYTADEERRLSNSSRRFKLRFPLLEYGITESQALKICYSHGFDWDGLYEHFARVSCFCCPLQRISELRRLWGHYPELWARMLKLEDAMLPGTNRGFKDRVTVHDLDKRFRQDRQYPILFRKL